MRRFHAAAPDFRPQADLNITPLIDVMLVLLVMFILGVPAVTHEVPIDLPQGAPPILEERVTHVVGLDAAGRASLDGVAMEDAAVGARLEALARDPATLVLFRADPQVRYERADQMLAEVKRAGVTKLGFEGLAGMRSDRAQIRS